jgi:aminopeptidase N
MKEAAAKTIYLKDYREPDFQIERVDLTFKLFEDGTEVNSRLKLKRVANAQSQDLFLNGDSLQLKSLGIDGRLLAEDAYTSDDETLTVFAVPNEFELQVVTWIKPQENKRLEGLYKSSSMFCTQCEAEGFRHITYYLDRPDVLSVFTTRIEADKNKYPRLLSNGNAVDSGDLADERHFVTWHDPFPKPCYLFALVAGDLHCEEDSFTTISGREICLRLFVEHKNADKCDYAIDALKRSMRWDEEVYGREYDLELFMIVAVDDFNMGAMENKGLNIFNSSCVLAKPETTTDSAYLRIEAIVAHEYFHNWSGNRVTCRDWFQLSLKEGFTVFRDAEFSADMNSPTVKRIEDVNLLRTAQFVEDAGPMSHPVRPSSYMEISNFYTLTVYEKGAEVVRMLHTFLGPEKFREGSDLYFERHDGQAVTTDDFVAAMEAVSGRDLSQFKRWYEQSGTPEVDVSADYNAASEQFSLRFKQSCPATPKQELKQPFHMPIAIGLIDAQGNDLTLNAEGDTTTIFELKEAEEVVTFENISAPPIPSLLRGFSAPVKLRYPYSDDQLLFLMANDSDGFNRWDASQQLALNVLQASIAQVQAGQAPVLPLSFIEAMRSIVSNDQLDKAMVCKLMSLPSESYLVEQSVVADVEAICKAREAARKQLANGLQKELIALYEGNREPSSTPLDLDYAAMAKRNLKNAALGLLMASGEQSIIKRAQSQFQDASNMTDQFAALSTLVNSGDKIAAESALASFYQQWQNDAQVMEQWFAVQSGSASFADLAHIEALTKHKDFDVLNPNKLRSVVSVFAAQNYRHFHAEDGSAYAFLADKIILLDDQNPQIASRLMTPLTRWRKYNKTRQDLMIAQLQRIQGKQNLSKDVREVVEKSLPAS